ncbi:MAG TPA: adenosine kinase [Spirochaetia bacterium]|nr:adenosine kinase [Spirochaetia bacterium]
MVDIYGIGNPLIDILTLVDDSDIASLGLDKGTMRLIDDAERSALVEFLEGREQKYSCGGSCPNTLIALASFGLSTALAGKVGDDEYGEIYRRQVSELPMQSELKTGSEPTGSSIILVTPDSERTMNTFLGANREFSADDVNEQTAAAAGYFYFTGYMWDTELQKAAILKALSIAERNGNRIAFDVADPFAVNRKRDAFLDLLQNHVSIAFANREEARILFNTETALDAVRRLSELCDVAVVKNGARGSYVMTDGKLWEIPAGDQKPVDTTGAGDMYAAGFLYGLIKGFSPRECGLCAAFVAEKIITQRGAQFTPQEREAVANEVKAGRWKERMQA